MTSETFLQDLTVVAIVAGLVTVLFHRLKQPVVLGYLLAGLIIGPTTPPFPLVQDRHLIEALAELGVIFLLFDLGLHFNLRKLFQVGTTAFVAATLPRRASSARSNRWWSGPRSILWLGTVLLALPLLIATLRKLRALAMVIAGLSVRHETAGERTRPVRAVVTNTILTARGGRRRAVALAPQLDPPATVARLPGPAHRRAHVHGADVEVVHPPLLTRADRPARGAVQSAGDRRSAGIAAATPCGSHRAGDPDPHGGVSCGRKADPRAASAHSHRRHP